jgi:RNA polymerase sigma-70 factor (ECF subfamily)
MSNRANDDVLRELALLAALDSVQARVDTSVIPEIQDWSGAVVGEFYGATVKQPSPPADFPQELPTVVSEPMAFRMQPSSSYIRFGGMEYARATDSQLMASLFQDDVAAWQEFVRRYHPLIARTILKSVHRRGHVSPDLVEDLVQEVFLKLCGKDFHTLKSFDPHHDQAIPGLLTVIACNVVQDHFRSAASEKRGGALEYELNKVPLPTEAGATSSAIEEGVLLKEIDRLLQVFPERDRTVFWLRYRSGLNAKEISEMQGIGLTVKGIQSLLSRIRRHVWELLASPISDRKKRTEP